MNKNIKVKCKRIKIILTDVDGVLTDGGMYYSKNGDIMKKFHARDGMAISLLKKNGIPTIIVTKEKTIFVKKWAKKMNIEELYDGITKKEEVLAIVCKKHNVKENEVAYVGDDVNDIGLMKIVGLSMVPNDANYEAKKYADYVCNQNGGSGVLREIADNILTVRFGDKKKLY